MKATLVRVEWLDARINPGWVSGIGENKIVTSYGILGPKTEECQVIYSSWDPQERQYGDENLIPLGMIKNITVVKEDDIAD